MKIYPVPKDLKPDTAFAELVKAVEDIVSEYRHYPYNTKIDRLRIPLVRLKVTQRRNKK